MDSTDSTRDRRQSDRKIQSRWNTKIQSRWNINFKRNNAANTELKTKIIEIVSSPMMRSIRIIWTFQIAMYLIREIGKSGYAQHFLSSNREQDLIIHLSLTEKWDGKGYSHLNAVKLRMESLEYPPEGKRQSCCTWRQDQEAIGKKWFDWTWRRAL